MGLGEACFRFRLRSRDRLNGLDRLLNRLDRRLHGLLNRLLNRLNWLHGLLDGRSLGGKVFERGATPCAEGA